MVEISTKLNPFDMTRECSSSSSSLVSKIDARIRAGRVERVGEIVADFSYFGAFWVIISIQKGECR